ncbi:MAG: GNAT family N-acyltransferase, partial [Methylobacter sp.]
MFDDHFEFFLADTDESKEIHYSIRYQVYCEEMGFENKDDFPLEQEFDEYDNHSTHFIVRHKPTGHWVGAMRLIFKNGQPLP